VVMHAQMAAERGVFVFDEVANEICEKLIRRHPHVFGDQTAENSQEVLRQWEQIKRAEKGEQASVLDGIPRALPALMRAQNAQKKAARVGFDWENAEQVFAKLEEEIAELREAISRSEKAKVEEEMGDLLFTVVNLARKLGLESEVALNAATEKFIERFRAVERAAAADGRAVEDCDAVQLNAYWDAQKAQASRSDSSVS